MAVGTMWMQEFFADSWVSLDLVSYILYYIIYCTYINLYISYYTKIDLKVSSLE